MAAGHEVQVWSRNQGTDLDRAIAHAQVIVVAIAMKGVAELAEIMTSRNVLPDAILVTATKGLDPATTRTPSQIWKATFPSRRVIVLSGPNLSKEIDQGLPAATVAACEDHHAAKAVQMIFASDTFRVYTNTDPLGTELGGTLKNVVAIAIGVCDGLNLGNNAKAALMTRAMAEIIRVGTHLGARPDTFFGLSGLGDMLATCNSVLSRNYRVGLGLAQGQSLADILSSIQGTAEGVNTARVLVKLAAQEGISVPISFQVDQLLNGTVTPKEAVAALMERDLRPERH